MQAARPVRPAKGGLRLLRPEVAEQVRASETRRLREMHAKLPPMEEPDRKRFDEFCAAAAERRVRERQVLVVAYIAVGALVALPSGWLIATTVRSRPAELFGYALATAALTVPAALALRGRRVFSPMLMAGFSAAVCAAVWWGRGGTPWWDPRWMLLTPIGNSERLVTGVALGSAVTVVLIIFALLCRFGLALVIRSPTGGGALPVRVFDHLLDVIDLLQLTDGRPGDDRRRKIDDGLRMAEVTLAVMARGGRPAGRRGRRHRREMKKQVREIGRLLRDPNPLLGLREADEQLLDRTATCLMAVCRDRLGDVLLILEDTQEIPEKPTPGTARVRGESRTVRRWRKVAGLVGPAVILWALHHFGFPMPAVVVWVLGGFCALVLVVGFFWNSYPEPGTFLRGLSRAVKVVQGAFAGASSAIGAGDGKDAAAPERRDGTG